MRRVRLTFLLRWSNKNCIFWVRVCSLSYPTRNAQASYYIFICGLSDSTTFYTFSSIQYDFREKLLKIKCVFWYSLQHLPVKVPHTRKHSTTQYHRHTYVFMYRAHYSWQILMKLEFSRQIFEKYSHVQCHENTSSGSRVVPCRRVKRQAGRQIGLTKLRVAFRNFAKAPKKQLRISEEQS